MSGVIRIETVEAVQFNQIMTSGRTTPLLLTCEKPDGSPVDAVVKFATGRHCTTSSLCAELIASQLAADLGLSTPTPMLVQWEELFTDSLVDRHARSIVEASRPPAFGSTLVTNGFNSWSTGGKLHGTEVRQRALEIFFFDVLIGNSDRGGLKPNILARGDEFRVIDHELAFRDYALLIKPPAPWSLGGFNGMMTPGAHIFATQLANGSEPLDFEPIHAAWSHLSDRQIEAYEAALPEEWKDGHGLLAFAIERIKACRDNIDQCVNECRRALNVTP